MLGQNHFAEPNQHVLTLLHSKFAVQSTLGVLVALSGFSYCPINVFSPIAFN
jgi:hypothetical protein